MGCCEVSYIRRRTGASKVEESHHVCTIGTDLRQRGNHALSMAKITATGIGIGPARSGGFVGRTGISLELGVSTDVREAIAKAWSRKIGHGIAMGS